MVKMVGQRAASGVCVETVVCEKRGGSTAAGHKKEGGRERERREGGSRATACVAGGEMRVRRPRGCEVEGLAPAYGSPLRGAGPFIHMGPGRLDRALGWMKGREAHDSCYRLRWGVGIIWGLLLFYMAL